MASSCVPFSQKTGLGGGQDEALSGSAGWEISVPGAMGQTKTSTRGSVTWLCLQADGPSQTQSGGQTLSWGLIMLCPCGLTSNRERLIFVRWSLKVPSGQGPCFDK